MPSTSSGSETQMKTWQRFFRQDRIRENHDDTEFFHAMQERTRPVFLSVAEPLARAPSPFGLIVRSRGGRA